MTPRTLEIRSNPLLQGEALLCPPRRGIEPEPWGPGAGVRRIVASDRPAYRHAGQDLANRDDPDELSGATFLATLDAPARMFPTPTAETPFGADEAL
jgi:hypothetical protein